MDSPACGGNGRITRQDLVIACGDPTGPWETVGCFLMSHSITRGKIHRLSGNLGGVYELTRGSPDVQRNAFQNIWLSTRMHGITRVILANHTDCAKYGANGLPNDLEYHIEEVRTAGGILVAGLPGVELFGFVCVKRPDGTGYDPDLHVVFEPNQTEELLF